MNPTREANGELKSSCSPWRNAYLGQREIPQSPGEKGRLKEEGRAHGTAQKVHLLPS